MKCFASDNTSGIHPKIFEALVTANHGGHVQSYGVDPLTEKMQMKFRQVFTPATEAFLVFNGTAANVLGLSAMLKSNQGVICSQCAHLTIDECGAPEKWLGSKLYLAPQENGKLTVESVERLLIRKGDQHYSQPKVLSLTQPTELGTVYTIEELKQFSELCKKHGLYFHMDGARLANAAAYLNTSLKSITSDVGVDVLSFGGTKNGMMAAEAIVFFNPQLAQDFKYQRKQGMQLASKHRFLAAQFLAYLENDLWRDIAQHAHGLAKKLEAGLQEFPEVKILAPVQSNAVFAQLPKNMIHPLKKDFFFYVWDEFNSVARWMITYDHTEQDIDDFLAAIRKHAYQAKQGACELPVG